MHWLYILAAIVAALILLLICPMGVRIKYDRELRLYIRIGFADIKILPKKKKIRVSDYSKKNMERAEKKRLSKLKKKEKKKPQKGAVKAEEKESIELIKRLKDSKTRSKTVDMLIDMVLIVLDNLGKRLKISFAVLHCTVGGKDPAATAITYGAVCAAAGNLLSLLSLYTNLEKTKKTSISVVPDFLAEKTKVYADIRFTVKFGQVFTFLFSIRKVIKEILKLI